MTLGNGVGEARTFNSRQHPTALTAALAATALMSLGWTYNAGSDNGNIMSHTIQRSAGLANASTVGAPAPDCDRTLTAVSLEQAASSARQPVNTACELAGEREI